MQKAPRSQRTTRSKVGKAKKIKNMQEVKAPVAKGRVIKTTEPRFHPSSPGTIVVEKTEYIGEIVVNESESALAYSIVNEFIINPGDGNTFPWLSRIAENFESYIFEELEFSFETESPTATPGYVGVVLDYNPSDPPPPTKVVALDFEESVRGPVWVSFTHKCTRKNLQKRKSYFCRNSDDVITDPSVWDTGNLFVIAGSIGASIPIGELWVRYKCRLMTPELGFGDIGFDGAVAWSSTTDPIFGEVVNSSAAPVTWPMGPFQARYNISSSGATPYGYVYRAPSSVVNADEKVVLGTLDSNLPVSAAPNVFYTNDIWNNINTTSSPGSGDVRFGLVPQMNSSYVAEIAFGILTGSLTSFDLNVTLVNGSGTVTLLNKVLNSTSGSAIFQIDVTTPTDLNAQLIVPNLSWTVAATTTATLVYTFYVRFLRPFVTGLVPIFALKPKSNLGFLGLAQTSHDGDHAVELMSESCDRNSHHDSSHFTCSTRCCGVPQHRV